MSAWPEAVWIVRKLERNFNFENTVNQFIDSVNDVYAGLRQDYNLEGFQSQIDNIERDLKVYIRLQKNENNLPDLPEYDDNNPFVEGAICLLVDEFDEENHQNNEEEEQEGNGG